jgi:hypothetical protein
MFWLFPELLPPIEALEDMISTMDPQGIESLEPPPLKNKVPYTRIRMAAPE